MIQLGLFDGVSHPVLDRLKALEVETLTPLQALQTLSDLAAQSRE